ncbi:hypothetical protein H2198_007169 [Neophaeococcomyces mojaviensis]|uniref:Uncharacterized protein n=1 Tax=Neophaeococcomyces mojaviensis TaxID=3383035 RepID=A0ACC3A0P4_9EURO|nr:hypothetical protein H2198_007169 [Knufia sp. JES_112]
MMPSMNSHNSQLPTPPPTNENSSSTLQRIFSLIEGYKSGRYTSDQSWLAFTVNAEERAELEQWISEDGYCQDKLHWGYFPPYRRFVIWKPTPAHTMFLARLFDEISWQLRTLAEGPAADFVKHVRFQGSSAYTPIDPDYGRHDPDGSFGHEEQWCPGVVVEAADLEKGKMLRRLAEDYILGSDLEVRIMVGFQFSQQKKDATLSIWRPQWRGDAWYVGSKVTTIRHADGKPNEEPEAGLLLHLRDFASEEVCKEFGGEIDGTIFIPCKSLYDYLVEAEEMMRIRLTPGSPQPALRKRRRSPTPKEELDTDIE